MVITVCGPLAFETAEKLYAEGKKEAQERFAPFFLKQFESVPEEETKQPEKYCYKAEIGQGGLFGALWEMGEALSCGMEIMLDDIPIRQEVVEILELFDESPYECSSKGSFLIAIDKPTPEEMENFRVLGHTTKKKARVIISAEGERFLTPPSRQAKDIADRQSHKI